jgi:endonuclease YncB( thermonuclease family)
MNARSYRIDSVRRWILVLILVILSSSCIVNDTARPGLPSSIPTTTSGVPDVSSQESALQTIAQFACVNPDNGVVAGRLVEVIDGDTISVNIAGVEERVRYIGINTPEYDEGFGPEAETFNRSLVTGQEIFLVKDASDTDQFDRLLRYVFTKDMFVNNEMVRSGYARASSYPPDTACDDQFVDAEQEARRTGSGFWALAGGEGDASQTLEIIDLFFNGTAGQNEPDEYVEISNTGTQAVDVSGWYLKDNGSHRFVFPPVEMEPGETCRVYTGENHPESCGWSFDLQNTAVWNNSGDCASLYNAEGLLVDEFCYPEP